MQFSPFLLAQSRLEKLIGALSKTADEPPMYGSYHITWLVAIAVTVAFILLFTRIFSRRSEVAFRVFTGALAITLLLFEAYKQLVFSYDAETDVWAYGWSHFPFQFCSTPLYVLPVIACLKDCKLRNVLCSYLATYGFVAGLVVMLYPPTVYTELVGINIQTMVHHGSMLVFAVYLFASGRVRPCIDTALDSFPVFFLLASVAMAMNLSFGDGTTFNMFFIAPDGAYNVPILESIFGGLPHGVYLFSYLVFFTLASCLVTQIFRIFSRKTNQNGKE